MAAEWRSMQLGEAITFQRGFDLPTQDRVPGAVPIVSSSGVSGRHAQAAAKGPGVVTGRYGTIGQVFYIAEDYWPLNTTLWVKEFHGNHVRFVSYMLQTVDYWSCSDKSSVPGVNRNDLHRLQVRLPPLAEQRAIASVLGALDDKIDLNRRMCQTLEEMARALFKSWFVDFDPVRAKMEGRDPGLPKEIADLFPSRLVDSELGPIPEGWKSRALGDAFEASKGLSYKGSGLAESGMPLHNLNSVYEGGGYKHPGIKWYRGEYAERHLIKGGDVIVANTEQGHDRLLIGYAARVPHEYDGTGLFSHHLYRLRPVQGSALTSNWVYRLLNTRVMHETVSGYANGTTVNMLPIDGLQSPRFVSPPGTLVAAFDRQDECWQARGAVAMRESESLQALRDTLLPKLISGEVRLPASLGSMQEVAS